MCPIFTLISYLWYSYSELIYISSYWMTQTINNYIKIIFISFMWTLFCFNCQQHSYIFLFLDYDFNIFWMFFFFVDKGNSPIVIQYIIFRLTILTACPNYLEQSLGIFCNSAHADYHRGHYYSCLWESKSNHSDFFFQKHFLNLFMRGATTLLFIGHCRKRLITIEIRERSYKKLMKQNLLFQVFERLFLWWRFRKAFIFLWKIFWERVGSGILVHEMFLLISWHRILSNGILSYYS